MDECYAQRSWPCYQCSCNVAQPLTCQSLVQNIKALYEARIGAEWVTSTGCHTADTLWKHAQPFPGWKLVLFSLLKTLRLKKTEHFFFSWNLSNYLSAIKTLNVPKIFSTSQTVSTFLDFCRIGFFPSCKISQPVQTQACLTYLNQTAAPLKGPSVNLSSTRSFNSLLIPSLHLQTAMFDPLCQWTYLKTHNYIVDRLLLCARVCTS